MRLTLVSIILIQLTYIHNYYQTEGNRFLVFHKNRNTIIGQKQNNRLTIYSDIEHAESNTIVRSYAVKNALNTTISKPLNSVYKLKNNYVLVVDSLGVFDIKNKTIDYVLLTQSPKLNLERLIDSLQPKGIIADGNNYKSYINKWTTTCKKRKLPFYQTGKTGAFIIDY